MFPAAEKRFLKSNLITIIVLFLVITAGGVVRSTGSGMGCPDWPKCFNQIIPPTDVSQLPKGYEEHYIEGRAKKNERFAKMIDFFGYSELAYKIRHDKGILVHEEFNVAKTWTEYANRLVGVVAGFCLLFTAIYSFTYRKTKGSIVFWSVTNVFVVIVQAWLGSIVVSTNLTPWIITVHMLLALVIVAISIYTYFKAKTLRDHSVLINHKYKGIKILAIISILLMLVQVVFGTEVREIVDELTASGMAREDFIKNIGQHFEIHRWFGYCSLILVIVLFFLVRSKFSRNGNQVKFTNILLILVGIQMLSGIILARFAVPAFAQTTHLVIGSLLFGCQYYVMLLLGKSQR